MAYDGKIAGHFPGRGNPNLDTLRIDYLAEGASTPSSISDMQKVKEVYVVPAGSSITSQNLEDYLVWRYFDELLNDTTQDQYLMFAFKPEHDISVNSLSIFTDGDGSANTALVICSDDGLLLYKGDNTQESTENTEIYGLTGIKRTRTFGSAITLYAGKTYWIHYHFSDCGNHRGAYFNGFNGHACLGKYKNMGNFSFTNFVYETAYPQYANITFTFVDITNSVASSNSERMNIVMQTAENGAMYFNAEGWAPFYIRNSYLRDHPYKGMKTGTNNTGWTMSQEDWDALQLQVNDYFMIRNEWNGQSYRVCQCTDPTAGPANGYTTIIESEQEVYKEQTFSTALGSSKGMFIQYYDNGNYANNWNQTYTDKRYYLEINGTERGAGDER